MERRHFLLTTAGFAAFAGMGASCQVQQIAPIAVAAMSAFGKEIVLVAPQLEKFGLSDNADAQVKKYAQLMADLANGITTATPATEGQSTLTKIEDYINAVAPIVAPFVSLVPGGSIIGLCIAALPEIELLVNLGASLLTQAAKQIANTAPKPPAALRAGATAQQYPNINNLILHATNL